MDLSRQSSNSYKRPSQSLEGTPVGSPVARGVRFLVNGNRQVTPSNNSGNIIPNIANTYSSNNYNRTRIEVEPRSANGNNNANNANNANNGNNNANGNAIPQRGYNSNDNGNPNRRKNRKSRSRSRSRSRKSNRNRNYLRKTRRNIYS